MVVDLLHGHDATLLVMHRIPPGGLPSCAALTAHPANRPARSR
jgi:hypothetical protein